jgi:arabinose-5-phosphate isomerase
MEQKSYLVAKWREHEAMSHQALKSAKTLFRAYKGALATLEADIGEPFLQALSLIQNSAGHVIVSGMGKSGIIGRKIAATLASTGTPSLFLHPAEAIHGDLGVVRQGDIVLAISNSGDTEEVMRLLPAFQRLNTHLIAMTGNPHSNLAQHAEVVLNIAVDREACPLNLAPTTSSLNTLVLGDALAVALMEMRGFKEADFAATHPGGALGRRLFTHVRDKMRTQNLPFINGNASVQNVLLTMTEGRLGMALVGTPERLEGIITDGDLRRVLVTGADLGDIKVKEVASSKPLTIGSDVLMADAEAKMLEARVQCLVVVDTTDVVVGVIQIYE